MRDVKVGGRSSMLKGWIGSYSRNAFDVGHKLIHRVQG